MNLSQFGHLVIVAGVFAAVAGAGRFILMTNLAARFLYEHENALWQRLGKPVGYFWLPAEMKRGSAGANISENRARLEDALREALRRSPSEKTRLVAGQYLTLGRRSRICFTSGVSAVLVGVAILFCS